MKKIVLLVTLCLLMTAIIGCRNTADVGRADTSEQQGHTEFMSYAGPVFPLSVLGDAVDISAMRTIVFDFENFGQRVEDIEGIWLNHNDIRISDRYTLTNDTASDKVIEIVYPFAGNFMGLYRLLPTITADNVPIQTELLAGFYTLANTWEDYIALLSDGDYLRRALADVPKLNQSVIVYEFTNAQTDNTDAVAPTLDASFSLDYDRTTVLSYGFNGANIDIENNFMRRSFFVPRESGQSHYLIIVGDDISDITLQGYKNGGLHVGEEIDISVDVRRYETVLSEIWIHLLEEHIGWWHTSSDAETFLRGFDMELFYRLTSELFHYTQASESAAQRIFFGSGTLEDVFMHTFGSSRVFFLTAEITIPAGESVIISADMIKAASFDFAKGSNNVGLNGYDLLTHNGSNLIFSDVSVEIVGTEYIQIVRHNFEFDSDGPVLRAYLDIDEPHYFIEVRAG